ncbi:MAG: dTDP-4-dehydrorhamnose 3,5-epimerase family protein, partial [Candidatus Eremiobacteraeota bacterium]|nr:dTDP-4-dehydrorhamnose 3,5-epimerase family protein [Candidatus Eremiobacteraeota bacterium]
MIAVIPSAVFPDVRLYVPEVFLDGRGYFKETFSRRKYAALGMQDDWVQDSVSHSRRNVIRGMH